MIRIAVLGAGRWGPNLIRNLHDRRRSEVAWIIDLDAERLEKAREHFPSVHTSKDPSLAFDDPTVDAVVIATPPRTHFALAREALEMGKHVLVEKPLTDSVSSAEILCEVAEKEKRILMVGHVFVHNAGVRRVKRYIDEGFLGAVNYAAMVRTNLGGFCADVDVAWDLAAHDVSIANFWLDALPLGVSAVGGSFVNPGIPDTIFATLRYPGDVLVNLNVSWLNPRKVRHATLVGDRGMLTLDDMSLDEPIRLYDNAVKTDVTQAHWIDTFTSFRASVHNGVVTIPRVALGEPLQAECEDFVDAIANERVPRTPGEDGLKVVRVLDAIDRSIKEHGRDVPVHR
jgi:predicted dehydrogenase